jgi:hypothetical protein
MIRSHLVGTDGVCQLDMKGFKISIKFWRNCIDASIDTIHNCMFDSRDTRLYKISC